MGDPLIFGGVKISKNKEILTLPDGTAESIANGFCLSFELSYISYGLTAQHGWEWFNSVRNEQCYSEYIEKIRRLMEKQDKRK